jgi:F420-dependent oxidoreductase-like protein
VKRTGAYLLPRDDLGGAVELARHAEALGYDSVWVTHGMGRDSFLVLATYAQATRRIGLGNGVVPIYPRHPVAMAQEAATLAELSAGRFRLGIGVSHRPGMEGMLNLDMKKPLRIMREYVAVLRSALSGQTRFDGEYFRVEWESAFRMPAPPPILLAGLSSRMLELAGEIADGVVLWLCAPQYIRDVAIPALLRGRQRAGKSLDGFEIVAAVPLAVTDDVKAATTAFGEELARYLMLPFYRKMLAASGFGDDLAAFDKARATAASPALAVPSGLVAALGGIGDQAVVREFVAAHRRCGVTLPAVRPIGFPSVPWYRATLEAAVA